ncbi:hypothetical protein RDI58_019368 [Solanum bulbocastanum]|uniref:TF-B3 domain-containing protein n=1 Tax=Solanum bulbocastanum TaxID=147425 RepID=A0AAN8Y6Y4_SOLBU
MKIPPKKPHFFKPIQPGFKNGLKIPIGFLKYLKGNDNVEHAILKRGGYKWPMKVNGHRFEAGWVEFVEQHGLKLGDILMFRHEGNMEFEVSIFDSTHCDKEYVEYMEEGDHTSEEISKKFKFKERSTRNIKSSKKASAHVNAATHHKSLDHPHFECIIREYCFSRGYLYLPRQFAYANGLTKKKCDLTIRDERQRSWNVKLSSSKDRTYIGCGWTKFFADNCLKKGNCIMFEVVTNGETPIWKFQVTNQEVPLQKFQDIMKTPSNMSLLNAQVVASTSGDEHHPCFISTLTPYCFKKSVLYLPLDFVKSNGLMNRKCKMVLKDEAKRCWSVWLGNVGHHFGITRGWTKFRVENGLRVGNAYKFELIKNGEIPIAQFHCKYSGKVAKREEQ